jgi:hypothetical protein
MFLMREIKPGAEAAAAAHACEAPEADAGAGFGIAATGIDASAPDSICWPQLPQKRAFAMTARLHLGQFMMLFLSGDFLVHRSAGHDVTRRDRLRI